MPVSPSLSQYGDFQSAYEFLNLQLFGGNLPDVMLTLTRTRHANGYIIPEGFRPQGETSKEDGDTVAEISINPETFQRRTAAEVLSTLAHEMVHFEQHLAKKASTGGYHNRDWGTRMKRIGLYPSHTGQPGGEETGVRMTHYIVPEGPFERSAAELIAQGWRLSYFAPAVTEEEKTRKAKKSASKTKYTCPLTGANAWARPGLVLFTAEGRDQDLPMVQEEGEAL